MSQRLHYTTAISNDKNSEFKYKEFPSPSRYMSPKWRSCILGWLANLGNDVRKSHNEECVPSGRVIARRRSSKAVEVSISSRGSLLDEEDSNVARDYRLDEESRVDVYTQGGYHSIIKLQDQSGRRAIECHPSVRRACVTLFIRPRGLRLEVRMTDHALCMLSYDILFIFRWLVSFP